MRFWEGNFFNQRYESTYHKVNNMRHVHTFTFFLMLLVSSPGLAEVAGPRNAGAAANIFGGWIWTNPTNILAPGAPYAYVQVPYWDIAQTSDLRSSNFGFTIPDGATILGIEVIVNRCAIVSGGNITDGYVCLLKNYYVTGVGRENRSTPWPSSMNTVVYGGPTDLWGSTWTPAEINAAGFCVDVSARATNVATSGTAYVDYVQVRVTYTTVMPVQLSAFHSQAGSDGVVLTWSTLSETNNYGFFIERRQEREERFTEIPNSFVPGHGTTLDPKSYRYVDHGVSPGIWYYRLRQVDLDGTAHSTDAVRAEVVVADVQNTPVGEWALTQNYPNPFNPATKIRYQIPTASKVTVVVCDLLGQQVATLVQGEHEAGIHEVSFDATGLSSGVYLYRMQTGDFVQTRTLTVIR